MDAARKIRFLYPPMLFLAVLLFGWELKPGNCILEEVEKVSASNISLADLGVVAAGGFLVVTLGFVIGSVSIFVLRTLALTPKVNNYDNSLSDVHHQTLWKELGGHGTSPSKYGPALSAILGHDLAREGVASWLVRRWNAFNLSLHCAAALFLSLPVAHHLGVTPGTKWVGLILLAALAFLAMARFAWVDTRNMNDFLVETGQAFSKPENTNG